MPSIAQRERTKAFVDFYGPNRDLLKDGTGALLEQPLEVLRFDESSKFALLRTIIPGQRLVGDSWEIVEFALPTGKRDPIEAVKRAKIHERVLSDNGITDIISHLALVFNKPGGVVRFFSERTDRDFEHPRINHRLNDLSCTVYHQGREPVMLAWVNYDSGHPRQISFTQLSQEQISQSEWSANIESNTVPNGLTVYHNGTAAEIYRDLTENGETYKKLGVVPRGQPFEHSQADVKVSFAVLEIGDKRSTRVRTVDMQGRPHLLAEFPRIDSTWYYDAQGKSEQFANIEDRYQTRFIYGYPQR